MPTVARAELVIDVLNRYLTEMSDAILDNGGTLVTYGVGTAVVVGTGAQTELGRISSLLQSATELQTPLTKQLAKVGKGLTVAILVVSGLLLAVGMALMPDTAQGNGLKPHIVRGF